MTLIQKYEDEIIIALQEAFRYDKPYITADMNWEDAGDEKKLRQQARKYSNAMNKYSVVFVGYVGKEFDNKEMTGGANIYKPFYMFNVLIFSASRRKTDEAHIDIYTIIETVEEALYKKGYKLYRDDNVPVQIDSTGLFRSAILVGKYKPFPHQSLQK